MISVENAGSEQLPVPATPSTAIATLLALLDPNAIKVKADSLAAIAADDMQPHNARYKAGLEAARCYREAQMPEAAFAVLQIIAHIGRTPDRLKAAIATTAAAAALDGGRVDVARQLLKAAEHYEGESSYVLRAKARVARVEGDTEMAEALMAKANAMTGKALPKAPPMGDLLA